MKTHTHIKESVQHSGIYVCGLKKTGTTINTCIIMCHMKTDNVNFNTIFFFLIFYHIMVSKTSTLSTWESKGSCFPEIKNLYLSKDTSSRDSLTV